MLAGDGTRSEKEVAGEVCFLSSDDDAGLAVEFEDLLGIVV